MRPALVVRSVVAAWIIAMNLFSPLPLSGQNDYDQGRDLWLLLRYAEALPPLLRHRQQEGVRSFRLDYMIGTSYCRTAAPRSGKRYLEDLLRRASTRSQRDGAIRELGICGIRPQPAPLPAQPTPLTVASVVTKLLADGEPRATGADPVRVVQQLPPEAFAERLFGLGEREAALQHVEILAGTEFSVLASNHFVVASSSDHTPQQLTDVARTLEEFAQAFSRQYGMPLPQQYVTVYLVPDPSDLRRLAEHLHGIAVPELAIGYTVHADQSIVAVIPRTLIGTLAHELVHLLMKRHFGDAPLWFDEGLASLYEESAWRADTLVGVPGWRGKVLVDHRLVAPPLGSLVRMSADEVHGEGDPERQAAVLATVRYLMLYLQERRVLSQFYERMRALRIEEMDDGRGEAAARILYDLLRQSQDNAQKAFDTWFRTTISQ